MVVLSIVRIRIFWIIKKNRIVNQRSEIMQQTGTERRDRACPVSIIV